MHDAAACTKVRLPLAHILSLGPKSKNTRAYSSVLPCLENIALQRIAELEKELAVAEERKNGLEGQLNHLSETVDDLSKWLDSIRKPFYLFTHSPHEARVATLETIIKWHQELFKSYILLL